MRLDFNVLWLDDQPGRVEAQIEAIARQMEEHAFNFNPTLCRTVEDVRGWISDSVFTDEVDLILVDWDLGSDMEGQEAIVRIREKIPYKDVVFYSAQTEPAALRRRVFDEGLEGIYCASREGLVVEVIGVFESLVKKVLDLDHSRGIIIGATSDIDFMVKECLILIFEKHGDDIRREMIEYANGLTARYMEDLTLYAKKLKEAEDIFQFMKAYGVFTSSHCLRMLSHLLKMDVLRPHNEARPAIVDYMEKVVPGRNILGHRVLIPQGKPQTVVDANDREITLQEVHDLRRGILDLRDKIRRLRAALESSE